MNRPSVLSRMFQAGMDSWSSLLPVGAGGLLILVSFLNLFGAVQSLPVLNLRSFLHVSEILVLTLLSPLLIVRSANVLALFLISYLMTKAAIAFEPSMYPNPAMLALCCCLGILMTLGDRLPWLRKGQAGSFGERLRSVLLLFISMASCGIVLVTMFKVAGFSRWFGAHAGVALAPKFLLIGLSLQLVMWLMVSMNVVSPIFLSLLALPTFAAALFITGLSSTVLIVPFIVCLALATTLPSRPQWAQS